MAASAKRKRWLFFAAVVLIISAFGAMRHDVSALNRAFDEIRIGMPGEQAEAILAGAPGATEEISILREGSIDSVTLTGKGGETVIIHCRRNSGTVLSGCVVGKEYYSQFRMAARGWNDWLGRWLMRVRAPRPRVGTVSSPVRPVAPMAPRLGRFF
jgi:hypothetical protein